MKKLVILLAIPIISVTQSIYSQNIDPTVYYIKLKAVDESIYSSKQSVFRLESAHASFMIINSANQKLINSQVRGQSRILFIASGDQHYSAEGNPDENMYDTPFLNLNSTEIKNAAKSISKNGNVIFNVESFVRNAIKKPTYGIPLLPAKDVLLTGAGDCTEHAILAVALLRSLNIPARAVVGMILVREFEGKEHIFIYHMWAEAYYGGKWKLVDATSPGEKPLNRYIAFTYHSLRTESPLAYLKAISSIQDLSVTYVK